MVVMIMRVPVSEAVWEEMWEDGHDAAAAAAAAAHQGEKSGEHLVFSGGDRLVNWVRI